MDLGTSCETTRPAPQKWARGITSGSEGSRTISISMYEATSRPPRRPGMNAVSRNMAMTRCAASSSPGALDSTFADETPPLASTNSRTRIGSPDLGASSTWRSSGADAGIGPMSSTSEGRCEAGDDSDAVGAADGVTSILEGMARCAGAAEDARTGGPAGATGGRTTSRADTTVATGPRAKSNGAAVVPIQACNSAACARMQTTPSPAKAGQRCHAGRPLTTVRPGSLSWRSGPRASSGAGPPHHRNPDRCSPSCRQPRSCRTGLSA
jgi:hypothetical protein